jgi:tetratricopeptide (TPR) repeat protein
MKSEPSIAASNSESTFVWGLNRREVSILTVILIATVVAYLPSLRNGFVFDDWDEFVNNKYIHSWSMVWKSFQYDVWWFRNPARLPQSAYYRPVQNAWFAANAWLFGSNPAAWHLGKIALHVVTVVLCFRVAQLLTGNVATGLLTAALFGVMPAHTGGVVFASAIPEPLSTAFELGAMIFLIQRKPGPGLSRGLIIAVLLFAGAMLTHESAILFPLIVASYVLIFEGTDEPAGAAKPVAQRLTAAMRVCAPFIIVVIIYMCARLHALGTEYMFGGYYNASGAAVVRGFETAKPHYNLAQLLMTLPVVLITYLAVLALPTMADPTHAVDWITHPQPIMFESAAALLVIAAAALVFAWRSPQRRIYLFCAVWGLLTIAPALNLNALWWLVDDRYLYAPSFGWSLAVAVAVMQVAALGSTARRAVGAAMAVLLVSYLASTMRTERYWSSDVAYFQRCVEIGPYETDYRLRLAAAMNRAGDLEGAARVLQRGTDFAPDDAHLRLKLAEQYQRMGRMMDFQREFQKFNELSAVMILRHDAAAGSNTSSP